MSAHTDIHIHETAFVTSTFRSYDEELSQDRYAQLWANPKTENWIKNYLQEVSAEEPYTHCLRNRFFLDYINDAVANKKVEVVINFGAGFSMYPFITDASVKHIEIDKPEIVDYKRERVAHWQREGVLPQREIAYFGVDFSTDYQADLLVGLQSLIAGRRCFILIEGVLFFLTKEETDELFTFCEQVQQRCDFIGVASFQDTVRDTRAFDNLLRFFNDGIAEDKGDDYQTVADEYYTSLPHYELVAHEDYFSLSDQYDNTIRSDADDILNEHFYVLQRTFLYHENDEK